MPPVGSARPSAPEAGELLRRIDLEVKVGVENTSPGRWVASVFAMISLANELFSSSG